MATFQDTQGYLTDITTIKKQQTYQDINKTIIVKTESTSVKRWVSRQDMKVRRMANVTDGLWERVSHSCRGVGSRPHRAVVPKLFRPRNPFYIPTSTAHVLHVYSLCFSQQTENVAEASTSPVHQKSISNNRFVCWLNEYGNKNKVLIRPVESTRLGPINAS